MCPRFPYPLEKGDKLRMYHQLSYLSKKHEILLVTLSDEDIQPLHLSKIKDLVSELQIFKLNRSKQTISLASAILSKLPYQVSYFYDKSISKKIEDLAQKFQPDHVYCQLTRMSEYAKNLPFPKTLDYMDAFGVGMQRRAEIVSGIKSSVYKSESQRMRNYERLIYKNFDNHTIISDQDRTQIDTDHISVIPNGIDHEYFSPKSSMDKTHDIGFVGNMGYAPNVDAAEYLINELKPMIDSNLKYMIAGARPDKRVKLLASKNVTITGWMDDVRDAYAQSKIFVAPLWQGTGQQNKILEAMAMGIPCITSDQVNNAIGARHGIEVLEAKNKDEFVDCIKRLLNDEELYATIKRNALTFVRENFSWEKSVKDLEILMKINK